MSSGINLRIGSVPTDAHAISNSVFYNSSESLRAHHIDLNGQCFVAKPDTSIQRGTLALNLVQRRSTGIKVDDMIAIPTNGSTPSSSLPANSITFGIAPLTAARRGSSVDYAMAQQEIRAMLSSHYVKPGQLILFVHQGAKFTLTVTRTSNAGNTRVSKQALVQIVSNTSIELTTPQRDGAALESVQLTNIPDAVQDARSPQLLKSFDLQSLGIGGLRNEFAEVFRRAFSSRIFPPSLVRRMGVRHVRGLLLFGPPGTGKTLVARQIGKLLHCTEPKIVNGPEVLSKYVGQAEENVRKLFADAEADQRSRGDQSPLHLIIFDEFDAICRQRGSAGGDSTGVGDNVVNQLLSKIDGVEQLNNVLLIGLTNRKDRIDEAILRPGRFEVHVEIGLPDEAGRLEILHIHTAGMRKADVLDKDVDLVALARQTRNFSGAELEGLVRAAQSHAFSRHVNLDNPSKSIDPAHLRIRGEDMAKALSKDIKPALGGGARDLFGDALRQKGALVDHGGPWGLVETQIGTLLRSLTTSHTLHNLSILLTGNGPGHGCTTVAASIAERTRFPLVRAVSASALVGLPETVRVAKLRLAFEDASRSVQSVLVLDDIERLIEYSALGGRYSNTMVQALLVLVKQPPERGKKLLVVGTTSSPEVLDSLDLRRCFTKSLILPPIQTANGLSTLTKSLNRSWASKEDETMAASSISSRPVPVKALRVAIELAAGSHPKGLITATALREALIGFLEGNLIPSMSRQIQTHRFLAAARLQHVWPIQHFESLAKEHLIPSEQLVWLEKAGCFLTFPCGKWIHTHPPALLVEHSTWDPASHHVHDLRVCTRERQSLEPAHTAAAQTVERRRRRWWAGAFALCGIQLGVISRLTYFDLEWDIMEPISYFLGTGTALGFYIYMLYKGKEFTASRFDASLGTLTAKAHSAFHQRMDEREKLQQMIERKRHWFKFGE